MPKEKYGGQNEIDTAELEAVVSQLKRGQSGLINWKSASDALDRLRVYYERKYG